MNSSGLFAFIAILFFGFSSGAENTDFLYVCKNDKAYRWLRAYKLDNGKCHTTYYKEGYLQVISSGTYFSSCEGVLHNVRKNIEEGGYKCSRVEKYSYLEIE